MQQETLWVYSAACVQLMRLHALTVKCMQVNTHTPARHFHTTRLHACTHACMLCACLLADDVCTAVGAAACADICLSRFILFSVLICLHGALVCGQTKAHAPVCVHWVCLCCAVPACAFYSFTCYAFTSVLVCVHPLHVPVHNCLHVRACSCMHGSVR